MSKNVMALLDVDELHKFADIECRKLLSVMGGAFDLQIESSASSLGVSFEGAAWLKLSKPPTVNRLSGRINGNGSTILLTDRVGELRALRGSSSLSGSKAPSFGRSLRKEKAERVDLTRRDDFERDQKKHLLGKIGCSPSTAGICGNERRFTSDIWLLIAVSAATPPEIKSAGADLSSKTSTAPTEQR